MSLTGPQQGTLAVLAPEEKSRAQSIKNVMADFKTSEFALGNWNELLCAVPNCLELMAICPTVAALPKAQSTPVPAPKNGLAFLTK